MVQIIPRHRPRDQVDVIERLHTLDLEDTGTGEALPVEVDGVEEGGEGGAEEGEEVDAVGDDEEGLGAGGWVGEGDDGCGEDVLEGGDVAGWEPACGVFELAVLSIGGML